MSGRLGNILSGHSPLAVLVSGGCDSEVLLRAAVRTLGPDNVLALTARTPFLPALALRRAQDLAESLKTPHRTLEINLMVNPHIANNTPLRCYHCKKLIYTAAGQEARAWGTTHLADGTNLDDTREHRPGLMAAKEENILHPLALAGITKREVRNLGEALGMRDPERPADSCLATRLQENNPVTPELLELVERMESPLKHLVRGRFRAVIANGAITVQFQESDLCTVLSHRARMRDLAEAAGFRLKGFPDDGE